MTEARGEIPKKIDRYEVIEAIGFGAMGAVYKAFDPLIKRPVAVKTLRLDVPPQSPDYKAFLERFDTEARTSGRLSHPNIVTLYDVGYTSEQIPYLAMEFIDGETVADLLEGEQIRPEVVIGLVSQIASAVDYAHTEAVIHRDIKPSNIIVYGGEKVKVTDFGIAKLMDADLTHSGVMMGTPSYMSPEQAMGEDLDGLTDIFSLGVVAFEMLSGQQPFPGNNVTSILYKLVHADPIHPDDLEVLGLLPDKWHEVFSKVLSKDPSKRYASGAEFVKDLELCLGSWFGALEGETVIMNEGIDLSKPPPSAISPSSSTDADETVVIGSSGANAAPTKEATVRLTPDSIAALQDTAEATLDGTLPGSVVAPALDDAGSAGERTVLQSADTVSESDETLYDDELEATATGVTPLAPTAPDAVDTTRTQPTAGSTPGTAKPGSKALLWVTGAAAALLAIVGIIFISGGDEPSAAGPAAPTVVGTPTVSATTGELQVASDPAGATVFVNDEERGTTPLSLDALPFGRYTLRLVQEGYHEEAMAIALSEERSRAAFDVALRDIPAPAVAQPAFVRIRSTPSGVQATVDGRSVGSTPIDRVRVAAGRRRLRLVHEGYIPWEDTFVARDGRTVTVDAILTAMGTPPPTTEPPPDLQPPPERIEVGTLVTRGDPGVINPTCIECPAVSYPDAARRARLQGVVLLEFLIDENGNVSDLVVRESGGEVFDDAVRETVSKWRYEPATKSGVRVRMRWVQRFRFQQGR